MIVYRLSKGRYANDLSGKGAEIAGGRWNSKGVALLYTGQSRALCTTEIAVHSPLGITPSDYWIVTIEVPDTASILQINPTTVPTNWRAFPYPHSTQTIGDAFVKAALHLVMQAPSAVVPGDFNYLINPIHAQFAEVKIIAIEPFKFDERLFVR